MGQKNKQTIDVQDAMDNLSAIAGIDLQNLGRLGIVKKHKIVTSEEEVGEVLPEPLLEVLDLTYGAVYQHLLKIYENPEMNWNNEKSRKGIEALMSLVGESAKKMEAVLKGMLGKSAPSVTGREAFQDLQRFYAEEFFPKFSGVEIEETGLKDFEAVKRDVEYELFFIRNESGEPYFDAELLRKIKLSCDFSLEENFEEDPLLKVRSMQDRDLHASAGQILGECHLAIGDYYHLASKLEENALARNIGQAVIALFLAANARYLVQNTTGKSCLQYFEDFHKFLRASMQTTEYQKLIAYPPDASDTISTLLLHLVHSLSKSFFERVGGVKLESIALIHRTMRKGEEIKKKEKEPLIKGDTLWNQFLIDDEKYRTLLAKFPNGPLFKILDLVREEPEGDAGIPFDPIGQENLPGRLYDVKVKGKEVEVLRIPSPTRQSVINKAEVIDEFRAFLRGMGKRKHLLVNLQDRTSWKEYARARALETLQMNAEFNHQLVVFTLPKNTDFYHQANEYLDLNQADDFLKTFAAQLASPEDCGFFFPAPLQSKEMNQFVEKALPLIHKFFFGGKSTLNRRNREDFIEIFYQFFVLKCIDILHPNSLSFTCKDGIDTGAASQAMFYAFLRLLLGEFPSKEEQDFLRWLLYTPALFIRERAIDPERLNRTLSALERVTSEMGTHGHEIFKAFSALYDPQVFKTLGVKHL